MVVKKKSIQYFKLIFSAVAVGILTALVFFSLKKGAESVESIFLERSKDNLFLCLLFPIVGLFLIYIFRIFLFRKKENKGIREVLDALSLKNPQLPAYKIPSHYMNGFLTIIFGGSTGIEVSSVVASAAIGSAVGKKAGILKKYRSELMCAGCAAAITTLFNSPLAGIFFVYEVMYRKVTKAFIVLTIISVCIAWLFNFIMDEKPLFYTATESWHYYAIPYFILLGIFSGLHSVYLTKIVIFFKNLFADIDRRLLSTLVGATVIGLMIYFFPALYGDGYHAIRETFTADTTNHQILFLSLLLIIFLKPVATSLTLASGGDGGVFAPSLVMGAFLGFFTAFVLNVYFHQEVIPANFMMVGMASVLGASIQAPVTSIFLVCGITGNYVLLIPLTIGCLMARITSYLIYPYTVYNHPVRNSSSIL